MDVFEAKTLSSASQEAWCSDGRKLYTVRMTVWSDSKHDALRVREKRQSNDSPSEASISLRALKRSRRMRPKPL